MTRRASVVLPARASSPQSDPFSKTRQRVLSSRKKSIEKHKKKTVHHQPKKTNWKKIIFWIVLLVVIIWLWKYFDIPGLFLHLIQQNPTIWAWYQTVATEVESRSLLGLLYASLFGSLFFISLPVEVIFLYYLGLNYYVVQIITIVLIGNMIGMIFNYGFGRLIGERVVKYFMKENYGKYSKKLERTGTFIILIGNIIPFPIEPFAVVLGAMKYRFSSFLLYTFLGKLAKFILLAFGYVYFIKYASPYLGTLSIDWFIESIKNIFVFW